MVLHTIVNEYDVLRTDLFEPEQYKDTAEQNIPGGIAQLVNVNGEYRVKRIFSTNPALYLDPAFQPDSVYRGIQK